MNSLATITSKRQLTIPSAIFKKAKLKEGDKVIIEENEGELRIKRAVDLVERLAGSVKVPKKYRGVTEDEIIKKAKEDYFRKKFGQ